MMTNAFVDNAKVMAKGQITIPKDVRDVLGVASGDRVSFIVEGNTVHIVNSAVYAMQVLQAEMAGEAERAGITSDDVGHDISCVAYGDSDDPDDICIECEDCCTVLVSAEDFNEDMAGDYKITHRLRLGGRTLLMGYDPKEEKAPYMTCYQDVDLLGNTVFAEAIGSDDYYEIAELFSERLRKQVDTVNAQRAARDLPFAALTLEHCQKREEDGSLAGKLVILKPSSLAPEYRSADYQLGYALGGFGCSPSASGRAVYFKELYSGETCRWDRNDILGIADLDKLPEWAKKKAAEHEDQEGRTDT